VASSWKARVLEKAEINQRWLFCERCVFVCFCWIWWMEPRSSLSFSCCFLFFPSLVFGFSLCWIWWMEPRSSLSFSCCFLFFPFLVFGPLLDLVMSFLNINDASWGEGNWNKMVFVVDNLIYNVDWIWLC